MDKIIISDLLTKTCIGISETERSSPQDILINVICYSNTEKACLSDSIEDCVNYSTLAKKIIELSENNHRKTVEAFAADIADVCLSHNLVQKVNVRVEKTSIYKNAKAVGVEIEREK